jgi:hypothetical protein
LSTGSKYKANTETCTFASSNVGFLDAKPRLVFEFLLPGSNPCGSNPNNKLKFL